MKSIIHNGHLFHALIAVSLAGATACYETHTRPVVSTAAYVEVGPPVEHIRAAPEVVYEGRPVYWYNSHWYYRDGGRWSMYRDEPMELRARHYVVHY